VKNRHIHFILASLVFYSVLAAGTGAQAAEPAAKKSSDWHLVLEPLFGIKNGAVGEYVYSNDTKLSELDWDIKDIWYAGMNSTVTYKRFNFLFGIQGAFAKASGDISDSDWKNLNDTKTNYSISDNSIKNDITVQFEISFDFRPVSFLIIRPAAGFDYEHRKFQADNGTAWYGNKTNGVYSAYDSTDRTVKTFTSTVITYEQQYYIYWLGATISCEPFRNLHFSALGAVSPYFSTESVDHHVLTGYYFKDEPEGSFSAFKAAFSVSYDITPKLSFCLTCYTAQSKIIRGSTYYKTSANGTYIKDSAEAGASFKYYGASLSVKFQPF